MTLWDFEIEESKFKPISTEVLHLLYLRDLSAMFQTPRSANIALFLVVRTFVHINPSILGFDYVLSENFAGLACFWPCFSMSGQPWMCFLCSAPESEMMMNMTEPTLLECQDMTGCHRVCQRKVSVVADISSPHASPIPDPIHARRAASFAPCLHFDFQPSLSSYFFATCRIPKTAHRRHVQPWTVPS
jgi:hypothetical protein